MIENWLVCGRCGERQELAAARFERRKVPKLRGEATPSDKKLGLL